MHNHEEILVIEDDYLDAMTFRQACTDNSITNPIVVFSTALEALQHLTTPDTPLPGLILLDLNLPGMSGLEMLSHLKSDVRLKRIPVVILTTSNEQEDRFQAFEHSVAGYIIKPMDYAEFVERVRIISAYWSLNETIA